MADLTGALQAAAGTAASAGGAADPNFNQTVLLLHGDGTNGAQNNTFLDSSTNNFTITRNGNTTQGTFSPFSLPNGEFSNFFDGSGDNLYTPSTSALNVGSGNFTIECFFNVSSFNNGNILRAGNVFGGFALLLSGTGVIYYLSSNGTSWDIASAVSAGTGLSVNTWYHLALVRNASTITPYINGVAGTSTTTASALFALNGFNVGAEQNASAVGSFNGYISNVRVVVGTAVYTSAFTPPSTSLTAISGTQLLTSQSNRFKDNSTNNFAITPAGNVSVQPFSPFLPSAAYDASVNGGSGYFDGAGDYLTAPASTDWACAGDYAVEAWVYIPSLATDMHVLGTGGPGATDQFVVESTGRFYWFNLGTPVGSVKAGMWNHLLATRSGTAARGFVNGVLQVYNASTSGTVGQNLTLYIGERTGGSNDFNGYISNIRYINGSIPTSYQTSETSVGTSVFTPPTAPFTATSQGATSGDVKLLLNFTNAGIFDNTGKNNVETVADAQIDTSVKKFGTGSMEFDGTGDCLSIARNTTFLSVWTGDFTIECWAYTNNLSAMQIVWTNTGTNSSGYNAGYIYTDGRIAMGKAGVNEIVSSTLIWTSGQWNHLAFVRNGTNLTIYYNGTSVATTASASTYLTTTAAGFSIGKNFLEFPSGTYLTNKLILPNGFTIKGTGRNTVIKQQYFSLDSEDGGGNFLTFDGNMVGIGTTNPTDITLQDITFDGNKSNNILFENESDNYLLYFEGVNSSLIKDVEIRNTPGHGLYIYDTKRLSVENCSVVDGSETDRYTFYPINAQESETLRVNDCLFENYSGAVDFSVSSVVSTGGNIIRNCGTGLRIYAAGKISTSNNIILGPSDEYIPTPDIFDSDFNSVNLTVKRGTNFESPVYLYLENGTPKNLSSAQVNIVAGIGTIVNEGQNNEYLSEKFLNFNIVTPDTGGFGRQSGYVQLALLPQETSNLGVTSTLAYDIIGTEFRPIPSGFSTSIFIGIGTWSVVGSSSTQYFITLNDPDDFTGISTGDVIKLIDHSVTPDISTRELLVEEKIDEGVLTKKLRTTLNSPISSAEFVDGNQTGYITIRNIFTIAQGRVGVTN